MNITPPKNILFDKEKLERFKAIYEKNKNVRDAVFEFEGHQFVVAYAGYLIQYLEPVLNNKK